MEVYVLDSLLRRIAVVDIFESLIWTERFADIGDFEMVITSTSNSRRLFVPGTQLAVNESYRVMTVETVEDTTADDGQKALKIKGRSLEAILQDRIAMDSQEGVIQSSWILSGLPSEIINHMFYDVCVGGNINANDIIPFITWLQTLYADDTIPLPNTEIYWTQDPTSLFDAIKNLADIYQLGFRLYRNPSTSQLYWNVYTGNDRTTKQTNLAPVIFSPDLGNLQNTTEMSSIQGTKNVAYVFYKQDVNGQTQIQYQIVYADDGGPTVDGFDRRVIYVEASNPTEEEALDIPAFLIRKCLDELALHRATMMFDGELNQHNSYSYGVDYNLGDLVEMRNSDGTLNEMRVTEQIFVHDKEGERAYPSLTVDIFINPGAWGSWKYNKSWDEMGATEYWADQE